MSKINTLIKTGKLESDLLRTFLAVADSGSFTEGANRIFRSQSAASLQIKKLEVMLGQEVFKRHGRGVILSGAGERLLPTAQHIVFLLDSALADLTLHQLEGSIRIGIPDEYGDTILPQVISQFAGDHPKVEIAVQCAVSSNFPDALAHGELDIAVYDEENPKDGLRLLKMQRTVWATSGNHVIHMEEPVPLALFARDCWWRDIAIDALHQAGKPFRVVYTSESVAGIVAAVEAGIAVSLLGESSLKKTFKELSYADGFPKLPSSNLVLECRNGIDPEIAEAMTSAIKKGFDELI